MSYFIQKRIEAYVAICFVAYKVYKEFEGVLKIRGMALSVDEVPDIANTMTTIEIELPNHRESL